MSTPPNRSHAPQKRPQPGRFKALFLAVLVHILFFAFIVFGITWQNTPAPPVQAELFDKLPPAKSPAREAPPPEPAKPPPKPEPPKPEPPKPEPPKPEPPKVEPKPEPPKPDPAIAEKLEREKKEKAEREKREREKAEKAKRERLEKQREEEARKKREQEEAAKKKREEEKRRQEEAEREAEKAREAERARAAAAAAKQAEFDRFVDGIRRKIRERANVPDTVVGNPELVVRIRILPGGEVLDATIVKRSGNASYDAAIERAIRSASPLPVPPANSELFPQFRELNLQFRHER